MTLRVVELFSGIGAQRSALERAGVPYESVACCEIDPYAYASYCAIHGDTPNLGDITKVERLPDDIDLLTYSFPCQDLSVAGCRRGMKQGSGTRSSLLWEVGRLLSDAKERGRGPEVLLMENVEAILYKKNISEFDRWIEFLTDLGYTSSYKVLNSKDFGIPQNRKRCFMVSSLGGRRFIFPEGFPFDRRLRDVLEDDVDESFYLSDDKVAKYKAHDERQRVNGTRFGRWPSEPWGVSPPVLTSPSKSSTNTIIITGKIEGPSRYDCENRIYGTDGIAPSVTTCQGGGQVPKIEVQNSIRYPCATAKGYMEAHEGDGLVMNRVLTARGTVQEAPAPTLTTGNGCGTGVVVRDNDSIPDLQDGEVAAMLTPGRDKRQNSPRCKTDGTAFTVTTQDRHGIAENDHGRLRIRYLTPRECWRLMGFPDSAYEAARDVPTSKTQLYKQAGNSIVVPCLEAIFKAIYIDNSWHMRPSLEEWKQEAEP